MFDLDTFIADCRSAVESDPTHKTVAEVVRRAMTKPDAVLAELGEPTEPGIQPLYQSKNLTIINLAWKPSTTIPPHNHEMWAVIGIYGGREDNIFWRRIKDHPDGLIEAAGAKALSTGDVCPMGPDIIHSVTNPIPRSRTSCIWRRFLRSRAQRMGTRRFERAETRYGNCSRTVLELTLSAFMPVETSLPLVADLVVELALVREIQMTGLSRKPVLDHIGSQRSFGGRRRSHSHRPPPPPLSPPPRPLPPWPLHNPPL